MKYLPHLSTLLFASLFTLGCTAGYYAYDPMPPPSPVAVVRTQNEVRYLLPPDMPRGSMIISSFGVTELNADEGPDLPVVHIRIAIENTSGAANWQINTSDIALDLRGGPTLRQAYVNSESDTLPLVSVAPGRESTFDLYFPLPQGLGDPDLVPAFDVVWKLRTDTVEFAQRTGFERAAPVSAPPDRVYVVGYAPYWWYAPWYPQVIVRPRVTVHTHVHPPYPHRIIVRRPSVIVKTPRPHHPHPRPHR